MTLKRIFKWSAALIVVALFILFQIAYWGSTNDCGHKIDANAELMKAVVYCEYGPPEVLQLENVAKPVPNDDQILVKIHSASVNPLDWHFVRGTPYIARALAFGLRKPKSTGLGADYAGTVEAIGKNVTQFKPGDEVFGGKSGTFAQYLCARADRSVVLKPRSVSFEQAAAVPVAAITALQGLRDKGNVQPGQKVLINGASGGVGTFAVQIAKSLGANVTGVCSGRNAEMVRSLGADQVIDYTKEDFTNRPERYDLILDNVGSQPLSGMRGVLTPNGRCVLVGGGGPNDQGFIGPMGRPLKAFMTSLFSKQKIGFFVADLNKKDLTVLAEMMQSGKLKSVIDRSYRLDEIVAAITYIEQGHARGKVVVAVE
jgi:NADPH:quinone reductase-like Zn-dependent oxidoreductase